VKRLKLYRERENLSLRQLAKVAGVHYVSLARMEGGMADPRLSSIRKIAKALGVSISDLVGESKPGKGVK
jgi:transcriptional regulator with XRE-family HTH domain